MQVSHEPEAVTLVPENEAEKELLKKIEGAVTSPKQVLFPPVRVDSNGSLVIWRF